MRRMLSTPAANRALGLALVGLAVGIGAAFAQSAIAPGTGSVASPAPVSAPTPSPIPSSISSPISSPIPVPISVPTPAPAASSGLAPAGDVAAVSKSSAATKGVNAATKSDWKDLTDAQKATLKPLEPNWATMSAGHKNKWLALSKDLPNMKPADQARVSARMTDWASLSAQQRAQARLNFADAQTDMSAADRKAKWAAYQALSTDEKRQLKTEGSLGQTKGAATAIRPSPEKLANVPGSAPAARLAASGAAKARAAASTATAKGTPTTAVGAMAPASGAAKRGPRIAIAGSTASAPGH